MKKLGEILVEQGWLAPNKIGQALQHQQIFGGRLGTCLLELNLLSEDRLAQALSMQSGVEVAKVEDLRNIPDPVLQLVPSRMAFKSKVVPFDRYSTEARIAMIDTRDLILQDELGFVTSKRIKVFVAPEIRVLEALEKHYGCDIDQRYQRIWDRLNRARYLWQETGSTAPGTPDAVKRSASRSDLPTLGTAQPREVGQQKSDWKPSPAPHLEQPEMVASLPSRPPVVASPPATPVAVQPAKEVPVNEAPVKEVPVKAVPVKAVPVKAVPVKAVPVEVEPIEAIPVEPTTTAEPVSTSIPVEAVVNDSAAAESVSTRPMPSMTAPETVEDLESVMLGVEERDHIAHALMLYLSERFGRVLCFMVRGDEVAGWMGTGRDVDEAKLEAFRLDFDSPSLFLNMKAGVPIYRGPILKMSTHEGLIDIWGGKYPKECLLVPVKLKGRLVAVLYVDKGGKALGGIDLGEMQAIGELTGRAFEAFLVRKKSR